MKLHAIIHVVDDTVAEKLVDLNKQFYQSFADHFSDTRYRIQPGMKRVIDLLPTRVNILDVGCGNGGFAHGLIQADCRGRYVGIDSSFELLKIASEAFSKSSHGEKKMKTSFFQSDISVAGWNHALPGHSFKSITAFAVLHHIPGKDMQGIVVQNIRKLILTSGRLYLSVWQPMNSERLRQRVIPWETIGLRRDSVDPGDYLLDWRRGGVGLRYVHQFSEDELSLLATQNGFRILDQFSSDGKGNRLGLYHIWEAA